jgi:fermentation-respiration switch protein FrsA (DUF1100 family)
LGAIRAVLLASAEPRFTAHVLGIGGADFPSIFDDSIDRNVRRYMARRRALLGATREHVLADLARNIMTDPVIAARAVDPRQTLLFLAEQDQTVPFRNGLLLYRALGRPTLRVSPLGHYSSILLLPWVAHHSLNFYSARWKRTDLVAEPIELPPPPPPLGIQVAW